MTRAEPLDLDQSLNARCPAEKMGDSAQMNMSDAEKATLAEIFDALGLKAASTTGV